MIVSIHQPNLFPYYPFFQKMEESDLFVILTHCQFEKNNFQNRFKKDDKWHTMSVNKGLEPILHKRYVSHENDWYKIKASLPEYSKVLSMFDNCISDSLHDTNINIIHRIRNILQIRTKIILDYQTDLKSTDRLIDICKTNNASEYFSGVSGSKYLDLTKFQDAGIKVLFQDESKMIKSPIINILKERL